MKFYKYISEYDSLNYGKEDLTHRELQIVETLEQRCRPFLKDWKRCKSKKLLMSGRKRVSSSFIGEIRKDRRPYMTLTPVHNIMDDVFEEKFGYRARSQSLFCSTLWNVAEGYGNPFIIFPIGKYEIIWSDMIEDLYFIVGNKRSIEYSEAQDIVNKYQKGNLCQALGTINEIMLLCDEYLAVNTESSNYPYNPDKILEMINIATWQL